MTRIKDLISLKHRKALVTGGAGHIGLEICACLLELGADVTVLDLEPQHCESACDSLNKQGFEGIAQPLALDLADEAATRNGIAMAGEKMQGLDILVHAAAFVGTTQMKGWAVPFEFQSVDAWDAALRVNLTSAFILVQTAKPLLEATGKGSIIFIGSIYGMVGPDMRLYENTNMANPAGYAASKGGLLQLTRYFATLLAPAVRVNGICAGGVRRGQPESFQTQYVSRTPLGRMATETDFKGAIAYLAGDLSAYVTGTQLVVDGGWSAW